MNQEYHKIARDAWLGLGDISKLQFENPLLNRSHFDIENPGLLELSLMRNPAYLSFACSTLLNINIIPLQAAILEELWIRPFPMFVGARGASKSFLLAVYALLKCILYNNAKIVIVGAAFRQSKVIFEYMETIWHNAPILRSICDASSGPRRDIDRCMVRINDSIATAIPLGDGSKIRGLRAHTIITDEFGSVAPDVYETVVSGFTSVSADPISNVKEAARRKSLAKMGIWTADAEYKYQSKGGNQAILSGTAGYDFDHFADYWKRYRAIIQSRGDHKKLCDILGEDNIPENFNWKDYSIIRLPYELIPEGFMDDRQVMRAKATIHSSIYLQEYGAVFVTDSDGFFRRKLIEGCVASDLKPIQLPSGSVTFQAQLFGNKGHKYVYGVDPASERDNFSIVVLELHSDHTRIVYCWSTNRKDFKRRLYSGLSSKYDFYGFCARKIRDLMKVFPCTAIALDAQGGGIAVEEALHDPDKMEVGELPIWPIVEDKEKDTDYQAGLHILHLCQFARSEWTAEANHGLKKDFESKVLLFPMFDSLSLELSAHDDGLREKAWKKLHPDKKFNSYDTLEDCVMEIEELKNELCTITMTRTGTGVNSRDRWDTPETKLASGRKGRLRKDRYSALVMANFVARSLQRAAPVFKQELIGGFTKDLQRNRDRGKMYHGPDWFTSGVNNNQFFGVVNKNR